MDTTGGTFGGRVYVAWSEFPSGDPPNGPSQILFAASSSTTPLAFSATQALSSITAVNHGAMPAVAPNGDVYVVWSVLTPGTGQEPEQNPAAPQTIQIVRSTDGGATFQNPDTADPNPRKTIASVTSAVGRMKQLGHQSPHPRVPTHRHRPDVDWESDTRKHLCRISGDAACSGDRAL